MRSAERDVATADEFGVAVKIAVVRGALLLNPTVARGDGLLGCLVRDAAGEVREVSKYRTVDVWTDHRFHREEVGGRPVATTTRFEGGAACAAQVVVDRFEGRKS